MIQFLPFDIGLSNLDLGQREGVYPQSEGSIAIVYIDASKGFVDLWVRSNSNMLNISLAMGKFSYQNWSKCSVGTLIFNVF